MDADAAVVQGQPEQFDAGQVPGVGVLADDEQRGRGVVEDAGGRPECGAGVEGDAQRLGGAFDAADGEVRVVGAQGAAADEDGVALGAEPVDVGPGLGGGDPAAAAVGGGAAAVEGGGVLPGDVGPAQAYGGQPGGVAGLGLVREESGRDVDPGRAQGGSAAAGLRVRVGDGVDHAGDPGACEGLGAGPGTAGVVAGFEGDVGGAAVGGRSGGAQGVDLGVGAAGPLVPALADDGARGVGDDAADDRVGAGGAESAGGELDGSAHGTGVRVGCCCVHGVGRHRVLLPRSGTDSGACRDTTDEAVQHTGDAEAGKTVRPGISVGICRRTADGGVPVTGPPRTASHPDFNRRSRNLTWSTGRWLRTGRGL